MDLVAGFKINVRRVLVVLVAFGVTMSFVTPAVTAKPWEDGVPKRENATKSVAAARAGGGNVTISGWATFSGQPLGSTNDKDDDSSPQAFAEANGGEMIGADFIYRPENEDFFFRLEVTKIPTLPGGVGGSAGVGSPLTLYALRFSVKNVEYEIRAHKAGTTQVEGLVDDPGGHVFGLFECGEATCEEVAALKGGYGTTGERIVMALPLQVLKENGSQINVKEGDDVGGLIAYTASHAYQGKVPPEVIWDEASLIKKTASVPIPKKSVKVTVGKKTLDAPLKDGYFDVKFPKSLFRKKQTTVKTKTCLGKDCKKQTFKVRAK